MKTNSRLLSLFILVAAVILAGCPAGEKPTEIEKISVIDESLLPPPREALETAPSLSGARLEINDNTLAKMANDGIPQSVLESLKSMQGQPFTNATEFANAVRSASSESDAHMDTILRDALITDLEDPPEPPLGEISIAQGRRPDQPGQPPMMESEFEIVYFDFDKSNIKPEFVGVIQRNAKKLLDDPSLVVTIEGHCDERGTNEYNLALGERRARSIRQALIDEGVPPGQLKTVSFGEERPVDLGHNEDAWAKNRRGEMVKN